jgi:preprotein translocase subunit SecG
MQQIILIIHVLVSIGLIALVLLQHGKGADVGAAFGSGASNTMFGSAGSTPFLVKVTGLLAGIFFLTSLSLTYLVSSHAKGHIAAPVHKSISVPTAPAIGDQKPAENLPASTSPAETLPETPN